MRVVFSRAERPSGQAKHLEPRNSNERRSLRSHRFYSRSDWRERRAVSQRGERVRETSEWYCSDPNSNPNRMTKQS